MNNQIRVWQAALINFIFSVLTGFIVLGFTRTGAAVDKNDETIKQLAPYTYVDARDAEIKKQVDTQRMELQQSVGVIRDDVKEIRNYIMTKK